MELHKASTLAIDLMSKHNLWGWTFEWNNRKRAFGVCNYSRKTIFLSKILTLEVSEEETLNTILHEIAHALVGVGHNHDRVWQLKALEIGCSAERCSNHKVEIEAKYEANCSGCGTVHKAHRRPKRTHWCKCSSRSFKPELALSYVQNF
jgi:predicted SprT family Zn-dependent metalloprotease